MVTSQDAATAVALRELGYDVTAGHRGHGRDAGHAGRRRARGPRHPPRGRRHPDQDAPRTWPKAVSEAPKGEPIDVQGQRGGKDGKVVETEITPTTIDGAQRVGIRIGIGYEFPFDVTVNIEPTTSADRAPG